MAEEPDDDQEGGPPPPEEGKSRLPQFLALIAVILIGQAAGAYVLITYVFIPKLMDGDVEEVVEVTSDERPVYEIDEELLFTLEDIILNPPDDLGEIRFLTAKVVLKLDTPEALAEIGEGLVASKVRDEILTLLGATTYQDMDDEPERAKLKEKMREHVNASGIIETGEVLAVYFNRFILQ